MSAAEAAALVPREGLIGISGFARAGSAKAVPRALAKIAAASRDAGNPYSLRILSGASTGPDADDSLAEAGAIAWRAPYQSSPILRKQINTGQTGFVDFHLSRVPELLSGGCLGPLKTALVEVAEITPEGRVYLTSSVGISPSLLRCAEKVIIEINRYHPPAASAMADIAILSFPQRRHSLEIRTPGSRVGRTYAEVDPRKVIAIVETNAPDDVLPFSVPDHCSHGIAEHVIRFLLDEKLSGRIPPEFLPLQSGVGNVANAVMRGLGDNGDVPAFEMYTEVLQDAVVDLMRAGRCKGASTSSLTVTSPYMKQIYGDLPFFTPRIVLRPQEISNHPGIVRQMGVIAMNTALEADIYGHVNSTHVCGTQMMNGIGGSSDFAQNAHISIFMCPSVAKGGRISAIVPMCSHVDHSEHSVDVLVTEQGLADLRGVPPVERAQRVIANCAHPAYRDFLSQYVRDGRSGHIRHDLKNAFQLHENLINTGAMLPGLDLSSFGKDCSGT